MRFGMLKSKVLNLRRWRNCVGRKGVSTDRIYPINGLCNWDLSSNEER